MTGAKDFLLICWVGMFWDRGDNFSKINERGSHRGTSHCGTLDRVFILFEVQKNTESKTQGLQKQKNKT